MDTVHMGELLAEKMAVALEKDRNLSIGKVMDRLGYSRDSFYKWTKKDILSFDILRAIGRIIKYDFSQDLPEMKSEEGNYFREGLSRYETCAERLEATLQELDSWKDRYIALQRELGIVKDQLLAALLDKHK